jgi:muramidase (phage lysozyme)
MSGLPIQSQAFLDAIAAAEGTGGDYNIIVGGKKFEGYEQHPNVVGVVTRAGPSTAAGKYQITKQTWDYLQSKYSDLTDFSPENQDRAAFYLATERYKTNTKGRDLLSDLTMGNTSYLRDALQKTWTGIIVDKDFEGRLNRNVESRTTTILKPVGFTTVKYVNEQSIRNKSVAPELEVKLDVAISSVLGPGHTVEIFSGGQEKKGKGQKRTGSIRHDVDDLGRGLAADVRIYNPSGKQVTDKQVLNKVRDFWLSKNYGSVGTYMPGAGIHFDIWTKEKLLPGMANVWSY